MFKVGAEDSGSNELRGRGGGKRRGELRGEAGEVWGSFVSRGEGSGEGECDAKVKERKMCG